MKIEWQPAMSVGEATIDSQHKTLLDQFNKLVKELSSGIDLRPVREILHFLNEYIDKHFSYEEKYMEENNYPGLETHKKIHQGFVKFFQDFNKEFQSLYTSEKLGFAELKKLLNKARKYLGEWFVNHILGDDRKYADYIENHLK